MHETTQRRHSRRDEKRLRQGEKKIKKTTREGGSARAREIIKPRTQEGKAQKREYGKTQREVIKVRETNRLKKTRVTDRNGRKEEHGKSERARKIKKNIGRVTKNKTVPGVGTGVGTGVGSGVGCGVGTGVGSEI